MRIEYSEEEQFPGQFNLWQANCARSLEGKKGQAALRELEAALLALPVKRLVANKLDTGTDCCAIGALARHKGFAVAIDTSDRVEDEWDDWAEAEDTEDVGVKCGMPPLVAWKVVEWNDIDFSHKTPEERYDAVLRAVRHVLRSPLSNTGESK